PDGTLFICNEAHPKRAVLYGFRPHPRPAAHK
ncbi:MAG: hypothetical protein H6Q89_5017, partial [Myxococcaceae bacterium]|nr:hypothetical protein [Myxococcaceae bacterium]